MNSAKPKIAGWFWLTSFSALLAVGGQTAEPTVREAMKAIVTRMTSTLNQEELFQLDERAIERFIRAEDWDVFATQYWHFEVNVPVVVSVMKDLNQAELPFWLPRAGFRKTELKVANEEYQYEVWQKRFGAGRVGLGINGFVKHRPHYFVCVGAEDPKANLKIRRLVPGNQPILEMREGAFIYDDWSDLVLTQVPDTLTGQKLLPTIRGRAREAQLVQAFRQTPLPSSVQPDQIALTWSASPKTTQTIQWRTAPSVTLGTVRYQLKGDGLEKRWKEVKASRQTLEDGLLFNDPSVNRFTATLRGLKPATTYVYSVGGLTEDSRSELSEFTTAPDRDAPFTFVWLSDTHNSPATARLLARVREQHPEAAFCTISGDLVGTGQYREDWDQLFQHTQDFARTRPIVPAMGNHDTLDGLGAELYLTLFGLPTNGPRRVERERTYSLEYGNALFLILDSTVSVEDQRAWLEARLARTKATWKFAVFHFPPYAPAMEYPDIIKDWCSVFDKYHVDFVLSGHVHHYTRTHPIKDGKRVGSPTEGTVYLVTVSVPNRQGKMEKPDYVAVVERPGAPLYHSFAIDGNRLVTRSCDVDGSVRDELVVEK